MGYYYLDAKELYADIADYERELAYGIAKDADAAAEYDGI